MLVLTFLSLFCYDSSVAKLIPARSDKRNEFRKNIIKVLFDNLPELKNIILEWKFEQNDANPTDNPIFVKSELEAIVGKCKNKFKVEIGENDNLIKISREM